MTMTMIRVWLEIDGERVVASFARRPSKSWTEPRAKWFWISLPCAGSIRAHSERWKTLAGIADDKAVKVVLRGVNVDIYKVLKLMKLASRFSFLA